jgi:hypothetical protein
LSSEDSDLNFLQGALLTMLDASDEGYIVLDGSGRCRMIGRRAGEIFGIEPAACVGKSAAEVLEAFADACDDPDAFWRVAAAPLGASSTSTEIDVRRPLARTVLCRAIAMIRPFDGTSSVSPPRAPYDTEENGADVGRIVFVRDVTLERAAESSTRQLRARLRTLMPFDGLTGLLNQRRLYEELGREHSRSTRAWDSYALLRLDIDAMKAINGEFGAPSGGPAAREARQTPGNVRSRVRRPRAPRGRRVRRPAAGGRRRGCPGRRGSDEEGRGGRGIHVCGEPVVGRGCMGFGRRGRSAIARAALAHAHRAHGYGLRGRRTMGAPLSAERGGNFPPRRGRPPRGSQTGERRDALI